MRKQHGLSAALHSLVRLRRPKLPPTAFPTEAMGRWSFATRPLMIYKQTGNNAVDIEQLKYAPLFAGKDIFKFLQLLPGVSAGKDSMSGLLVRGGGSATKH